MKELKKQKVKERLQSLDISYDSLDDAIKRLQDLKNYYKDKKNLRFDTEYDYGELKTYLCCDRFETDAELALRNKQVEQSQKYEREQYLRLKKKYELTDI